VSSRLYDIEHFACSREGKDSKVHPYTCLFHKLPGIQIILDQPQPAGIINYFIIDHKLTKGPGFVFSAKMAWT